MTVFTIKELSSQLMNSSGLMRVIDHIVIDRLEAAELRIKELEASQEPRPMEDAPKGVSILVKSSHGWEVMQGEPDGWGCASCNGEYGIGCDQVIGWLPLPDQDKDES